ncbi:MAG: CoA pyrophosphatase [Deltaproteobacteria bacterium]|nr:CoA pyrophosphatase [Deltaproteobacteria bacterium]
MSERRTTSREITAALVRERLQAHRPQRIEGERVSGRAAVATILRERSPHALEVLLIRRAEKAGDPWSGHMAFPGGKQEKHDLDLEGTARRETSEEIGLSLERFGEPLGHLDDVPAYARGQLTGMVVTPTVWLLHETPVLSPNYEVSEIHWASMGTLMSGELDTTIDYPWQGQTLRLPGFRVGERVVWGLTHRMLSILFERLQ